MNNQHRSVDPAAQQMLVRAGELGSSTAWDRFAALQPLCGFGDLGICCDICFMGPCRIDPFGDGARVGTCGADAHLIVARNFARAVAAGTAAHSDHGREVVEVLKRAAESGGGGRPEGLPHRSPYTVSDPARLRALAREWGIAEAGRSDSDVALQLAEAMAAQFGQQHGTLVPARRAPKGQRERWEKLGITPRGIDREVVELLHRTHHGVESDPIALLRAAMRTALADGWGGSMLATDVQDVLFGGPRAIRSRANLGVLEERQVNVLVHGHEPALSEMIVAASREPAAIAKAKAAGAEGINVAGICCTANEILMRQGMPVAGNYLHQELALLTGAVDAMVVDVQCVMPSLPQVASCHHTKVISTSPKAHIPGAEHIEFEPARAREIAAAIVAHAIEAYSRRDHAAVRIPRERMDLVAGFTNENLPHYLGGRFRSGYRPLVDAVAAGRIRGIVGVVGCNTTRVCQDSHHLALVRHLLARDVLVVQTGCSAIASAKAGLMRPEAALEHAGPGLRQVCEAVGIPPVIHVGSCVDNSRILNICTALVAEGGIGSDLSELPVAAAAPEAMSEKAVAIGLYAVASGIFTAFLPIPRVAGSHVVRRYLEQDVEQETGGKFLFTNDVQEASRAIVAVLDAKRKALKLAPVMYEQEGIGDQGSGGAGQRAFATYEMPRGLEGLGCGHQQLRSQARPPTE
jgi:carbon-monoxide dehydrogenase catalytic subunit